MVGALLLLLGCNEPPGLTLEVVPLDPSIEYVEVYLADHCDDCPDAMTPPMMRAHTANMFETDYAQVFSASKADAVNWKNGHAFFRITSQDTDDYFLPYLLIIGFDAARTPIALNRFAGVTIPASNADYWQVLLDEHVSPLTDAPSDEERIAIWGANRTGPRCVLVVNGDGRADGVVPVDDPDCDGVMSHECAPYVPNAMHAAPRLEQANCVIPIQTPVFNATGPLQVCLLGGPACTDGGLPSVNCDPLDVDYCMPSKACGCFDWNTCTTQIDPRNMPTVPFVNCLMAVGANGTECPDSAKRDAEIDLGMFISGGGGTKCTSIKVHELMLPLGPFDDHIIVGGATFELANFQNCKVDVKWFDDYMRTLQGHSALLDVALDNGKHMLVPLLVRPSELACESQSTCRVMQFDPNDTMLLCAKPAMDSTTCIATAAQCPDSAAACGARCCGRGERCVDGECRCGDGTHCADDTFCVSAAMTNPPSSTCGDVCCSSGPGTPACF